MSWRASGLKAWAIQRATAVYLALFGVYLAQHLLLSPPTDYAAWRDWVARPLVSLGLLVFVPALLAHVWVGIRDVLIDYVRPIALRAALLTLLAFALLACGLWAVQALILARLA